MRADKFGMRTSIPGRVLARIFAHLPFKRAVLKLISKAEGGEMYSQSLRRVLTASYGVHVGDYSYGSLLHAGAADADTRIGRYVSVGPNVRRFGASHPRSFPIMHPLWYNPSLGMVDESRDVPRSRCYIGDDAWIGANVVILPSCRRIGIGAIIGAGAIVTNDIPDFAVAIGVPARIVSFRFDDAARERLLSDDIWRLTPAEITRYLTHRLPQWPSR